jgi:hypothetical protein
VRVQLGGREDAACSDVREAHQGVHQSELSRVVQLQTGDTFTGWQDRGAAEGAELPAVHEGFQDVLLDIQVVVDNRGQLWPELREMVDGLGTA